MAIIILNTGQIIFILMMYVFGILMTFVTTGAYYYSKGRSDERQNILCLKDRVS